MKSALFNCFALLLTSISAWSINGHLFTANIAENRLLEQSPDSLEQAITLLKVLEAYNATLVYHEENHPFVECSTFADDIKYHGGAWQSDFHFIDEPYYPNGDPENYDFKWSKHNLTFGIESIIQWISPADDGQEYLESYMYDYIQNRLYPGEPELAQSYALRLLIHYVGDIHQPFHSEANFSPEFPDGDKGANLFELPYHYNADELHAVFDLLMYSERKNIARPINDTYWPTFEAHTLEVQADGIDAVQDPSSYENFQIEQWSDESYNIAITLYDGIVQNVALPQWYLDNNLVMCHQRVTLGGYRLAHLIEYMFPARETAFLQ